MKYLFFKDANHFTKLFMLVFFAFTCVVIMSVISVLLSAFIFDIDISNVNSYLKTENPENIPFIKFFQSFYSIGMFLIPAFLFAFLFSVKPLSYLNADKKISGGEIILVLLIIVLALPGINYAGMINSKIDMPDFLSGMDKDLEKSVIALLKADSITGLIINIFVIAFLPAVGEEFLFRGVIQKIFISWTKNIHIGIIVTAVIFSAFHFQFSGFIPRFLLGVLFGYMLVWTGKIILTILAHFINNAVAVVFFYLYYGTPRWESAESIGAKNDDFFIMIISLTFTLSLLFIFRKHYSLQKAEKNPTLSEE